MSLKNQNKSKQEKDNVFKTYTLIFDDESDISVASLSLHNELSNIKRQEFANKLFEDAEKTLKKWLIRNKYEKAIDLFQKAATHYRLDKKYEEAANALTRSAEIYITNLKNIFQGTEMYIKAAQQLRHSDPSSAYDKYKIAIKLMTDEGRLSSVAKLWKEIAVMWEYEHNVLRSLKAWKKARYFYECEGQNM